MLLWLKVWHLVFIVTWFSGLFYLPRLFVYHALAHDTVSNERFKIMEKKLYYNITTPSAVLTIAFGMGLFSYHAHQYWTARWMQIKLISVLCLIGYHVYLGYLLRQFYWDRNHHSHVFYRVINEIPAVVLILVVGLAVFQPFSR